MHVASATSWLGQLFYAASPLHKTAANAGVISNNSVKVVVGSSVLLRSTSFFSGARFKEQLMVKS